VVAKYCEVKVKRLKVL